ncbi:unnamed protein product [Meganyctiphanes norvegica]|uniref:guanylate cyclase n=1 Tax=Meganyctiphanes norvegica TaxID=48144 RepID=A0AAV2PY27_MEGNR
MGYMVYMDNKGDAEGNYTLIGRLEHHSNPGEYGLYPIGGFQYPNNFSELPRYGLENRRAPIDEPPCGYYDEMCQSAETMEIVGAVSGGIMVVLVMVACILYRNWRYEQELDSLLWKIDSKDIQINEWATKNPMAPKNSKKSRGLYSTVRTSQLSLTSNPDIDFRHASVYTQLGFYKGRVVAVKPIASKAVDVTRKVKLELKVMRDLHHDNLLSFIGACVDPANVCIVVEYCSRGSLKDILENEDVKLDNMFIASLVGDIIQGMIFLHDSAVRSHGNLKTSNCLVDSRWVVKIADFGIHALKSEEESETEQSIIEDDKYQLYKAPELLRDTCAHPRGTQKGDVYSFAIVLYEIHGRRGPYGITDKTPAQIVTLVMAGPQPGYGFTSSRYGDSTSKPLLGVLESCFDCVRTALPECWAEHPDDRPDMRQIRDKLRPLRKGMKPNIFDNMLAMMEKYANNLEALVDERTDQLIEEKKKTEALLYEMLPRYVAEQLKSGFKVEAESFDQVTIYFSDIVGFTEMSAESTPLQVIDFLSDLYTCFDSIIGNYDVYKVETIGDAYMVENGLELLVNGNEHAGEVSSMSLHLLDAIKKFKYDIVQMTLLSCVLAYTLALCVQVWLV